MNEQDIIDLIRSDRWMMSVLREAEKLNLPDWMIGSGFLRTKVWDYLHGITREIANTKDIDLAYFDKENTLMERDAQLSTQMSGTMGLDWEIINQAYTHNWHHHKQYSGTAEALSHWTETPTCVAVTLSGDEIKIIAPHGIDDLVNLIVRPSPDGRNKMELFYERINSKEWLKKWPKLKVMEE